MKKEKSMFPYGITGRSERTEVWDGIDCENASGVRGVRHLFG
jgi:hypothetical protein